MLKFVTALISDNGGPPGCSVCDMPTPASHVISDHRKVSCGAVVARTNLQGDLSRLLMPCIRILADGTAALSIEARQYVTAIFASPSTEEDVKTAATLNPVVAHWLLRRLPEHHDWGSHIARIAADQPRFAETADSLLKRRFEIHHPQGFRLHVLRAKEPR